MMSRLVSLLFLQLISLTLMAQGWIVPDEKRGKLSPFAFSEESRKTGERLYTINCMSCHGSPGKGNFINLVPSPGDPATEKIQHNSDGEIFFKITTGRGPMPSFKNKFSGNDIWNIISFLRSFNTKYIQAVMPVIKSAAYPGAVIGISLRLNPAKDLVIMSVSATGEKSTVPVKNAAVNLFVKRTFGFLLVDEEKTTDSQGIAGFRVPKGLPGDTAGNVHLSARFGDEDIFGTISKDTILQAGEITVPESLVKNRAMWNTVRKAPVWVILTYGFGVIAVWGFIFYVLFLLRDIFVIGAHLNKNRDKEDTGIKGNLKD
jgi:mono/diheme cytochrome c family protein